MIYFILQWNSACSVHCQWFKNQIQQHSHKSIQYNTIQCLIQCIDVGRDRSICAINRSRCAIERSIWSRSNRSIAQQSVDRAMNIFARLTDRATSTFSVISRSCRICSYDQSHILESCTCTSRRAIPAGSVDRADWPIAPNIDNCPYHYWWLTLVVDVHKNSVVNNPMSINSSEIETWE